MLVPESKTSLPWVRVVGVFDVLVSEPRPSLLWVRVVGVFDVLVLELKRSLLWVCWNSNAAFCGCGRCFRRACVGTQTQPAVGTCGGCF